MDSLVKLFTRKKKTENDSSQAVENSENKSYIPIDSRIGFFGDGIKKSEVRQALISLAERNFGTTKGVYYKIVKFNDGYAYELHHGLDKSALKDILSHVTFEDCILKTDTSNYKLYLKNNGTLSSLKLRKDDPNIDKFYHVQFTSSARPLINTGFPFFVVSAIFAFIGLVLLIASAVNYTLNNKVKLITYRPMKSSNPVDQLDKFNNVLNSLDKSKDYLLSLNYKNGLWFVVTNNNEKISLNSSITSLKTSKDNNTNNKNKTKTSSDSNINNTKSKTEKEHNTETEHNKPKKNAEHKKDNITTNINVDNTRNDITNKVKKQQTQQQNDKTDDEIDIDIREYERQGLVLKPIEDSPDVIRPVIHKTQKMTVEDIDNFKAFIKNKDVLTIKPSDEKEGK